MSSKCIFLTVVPSFNRTCGQNQLGILLFNIIVIKSHCKLQVLVEVAETVFTTLGKPEMDLQPWEVVKHSPPELQRQMNGYACGFFVLHAMRVIGNSESLSSVTNNQTANVRREILDLISNHLSYDLSSCPTTYLIS